MSEESEIQINSRYVLFSNYHMNLLQKKRLFYHISLITGPSIIFDEYKEPVDLEFPLLCA